MFSLAKFIGVAFFSLNWSPEFYEVETCENDRGNRSNYVNYSRKLKNVSFKYSSGCTRRQSILISKNSLHLKS